MKRRSNNQNEEVTLFVSPSKLIVVNNKRQIDYASRTIQLTETNIYTYVLSQMGESRSRSKSDSLIQLDKFTNYEYQYRITSGMRPKLLLYQRDPDILAYLRELKAPDIRPKEGEEVNIVAIAVNEEAPERYINGFIFTNQKDAIGFYEGLHLAIGYQLYLSKLQSSLSFNHNLSNRIGETLNGRCIVDPLDYSDTKQEEEIAFMVEMLQMLKSESLFNFESNQFEFKLIFKITDDTSQQYACKFIKPLQNRIQRLILSQCELTSNRVGQMLLSVPHRIIQRLTALQALDLSKNYLSDDIFTTLSSLLKFSKNVHSIDLSHNSINFEKDGILYSFLMSISRYKLKLNLSSNMIKNIQLIAKYFVNIDGNIPISSLNIYDNPFKPQHLSTLIKAYLERKQANPSYVLQLKIGQLEFQDPAAFEFLKQEFRQKEPTALSLPLSISRHAFRKRGKDIGMTQEEVDQSAQIQKLIKQYGAELYCGNFYKRKKIKEELVKLGFNQDLMQLEPTQMQVYRIQQENFLTEKVAKSLNFDHEPKDVISALNESLRFSRRKGLTGPGLDCLAYIKVKIEEKIDKLFKTNNLDQPFRELFYQSEGHYQSMLSKGQNQNPFLRINYQELTEMDFKDLQALLKREQNQDNAERFFVINYLLLPEMPEAWQRVHLENCLSDPRLGCTRIVQFSNFNTIKFKDAQRLRPAGIIKKSTVDIAANYGIENYRFNRSFIDTGVSSSGYPGILSPLKYDPQNEPTIYSMIEVFNNFMQILYHTPDELSEQGILYTNTISDYLMQRQNENDNDLKCLLAQELFLRIITYYDSSKHKTLKRGILLSVCEFLLRRVAVEDDLAYRVMSQLIRTESFQQSQMNIHFSDSKFLWEGKVDWKIKDNAAVKELLLNRGKIKVMIADIANQQLEIPLEIDELASVTDLWAAIKENFDKIAEFSNISKDQLDFYWISGVKSEGQTWDFKFLLSYQHIGKLIFQEGFQKKFYIRRVLYAPQHHSIDFLRSLSYQQLLCLFVQARQSFRQSAFMIIEQKHIDLKLKMTAESIWIQTLIQEEIVLNALRRNLNSSSQKKYRDQREQIINTCLVKMYSKYLPVNSVLNEENRNSIVTELRAKKNEPIPEIINQSIKEHIINFIEKIGVCAYTTTVSDSKNRYIFFANHAEFVFIDRTASPAKYIRTLFRNILWFQLTKKAQPNLRFDTIQSICENKINRYSFSIEGEQSWLSQCYSMLINLAKARLHYPDKLLFMNQDSQKGLSSTRIDIKERYKCCQSPLIVDKFMEFSVPRCHLKMIQQVKGNNELSPMKAREGSLQETTFIKASEAKKDIQEVKLQKPKKDKVQPEKFKQAQAPVFVKTSSQDKQKLIPPIPSIPERSSQSSARRNSQKNFEIEEIMQNVIGGQNEDDQAITARRSSVKGTGGRRRSRNR